MRLWPYMYKMLVFFSFIGVTYKNLPINTLIIVDSCYIVCSPEIYLRCIYRNKRG